MRVKLQLVISHDDGHEETVTDVITLTKNHQRIEHLGLSLAESKQLLGTLQRHILQQQVTTFLDTHATTLITRVTHYLWQYRSPCRRVDCRSHQHATPSSALAFPSPTPPPPPQHFYNMDCNT